MTAKLHTTRLFKLGSAQVIPLPAHLGFDRDNVELEIERIGEELRIPPARRLLMGVLVKFAAFSPEFMKEGRGEHQQVRGVISGDIPSAGRQRVHCFALHRTPSLANCNTRATLLIIPRQVTNRALKT